MNTERAESDNKKSKKIKIDTPNKYIEKERKQLSFIFLDDQDRFRQIMKSDEHQVTKGVKKFYAKLD